MHASIHYFHVKLCDHVQENCFSCVSPSGYIEEFEIVDDHRGGKIVVNLTGRLNKVRI